MTHPHRPAKRPAIRRVLAAALIVATAAACSDDEASTTDGTDAPGVAPNGSGAGAETATQAPASADAATYPDPDWATADPASLGMDPAALSDLAAYFEGIQSNCMLVVKDGQVVAEQYWNGTDATTDQEVFSASKSVTSTLVGIAQDLGLLDIDDPASDYITEWQGTDSEDVTIRNLISNDSGRFWSFDSDYVTMTLSPDKTAYAMGLGQQQAPGTYWEYNNAAIQTLEAVLERATGTQVVDFAQEHLFGPIGMGSTIQQDASGNTLAYMGVQTGCRDAARFGYLFLHRGLWAGEQVVSADWVAEATAPSQDLNAGYGFLWWLNTDEDRAGMAGTTESGLEWPDAPLDAYAALGLGNQVVLVMPSQDMVVVRLGGATTPGISAQDGIVNQTAGLVMAALGETP